MKKFLISITLTLSILLGSTPSFADVAGLVPCSQSASFSKRLDSSVKKLEARLKKYKSGTPAALAIELKIATTIDRFDRYSKSELLCGKDGLPHLIADGRPNHAVEFVVPGILFIYITGWIGWVGRKYLRTVLENMTSSLFSSHAIRLAKSRSTDSQRQPGHRWRI